ncbi:MAG: magnesium transporter CorA family protein [Bacteroidales bacterium]|nr:magnesium transporter CorA family protein [Bacteroidales bacterium]
MIETIQHNSIRWLDITNPSEADYRMLLEEYEFHPLDIEDCRSATQRPKIDEYDDYYFLILHFPYFDQSNKNIRIREVKIFWGKDYIITVGKAHWAVKKLFDEMQEDLAEGDEETQEMMATSDQLLYHLLNRLMLETNTLVQRVGAEVDLINYDIFNKKARSIIEQISVTRRNIILLNTTFKPQLRLLHMFESGGIKGFVDPELIDMEDYWGNILDQYQKMFDLIEDYGELIEGLSQTFDSLLTNRTNEIMRVLTYFNTVMLPLTVLTGIFGMNVEFPFPMGNLTFYIIFAVMVVITVSMLIFFNRRTRK